MHELSIALSLIDEVGRVATRERAASVQTVRVQIGRMSGVANDALLFAWELARAGTIADNAELHIEDIEIVVFCPKCERERSSLHAAVLACAVCGTQALHVVHGRELQLVAVEVVS